MAAGAKTAGPIGRTAGAMVAPLAGATIPAPTAAAWTRLAAPAAGARGAYTAPVMASGSVAGRAAPAHDSQWFERIHVIPRSFDLGLVLGDRQLDVEVWNAYRRNYRLWDIEIVGPGSIDTGFTPTLEYAAFHSQIFTLTVFGGGTGLIDALLSWRFRIRTGAATYVPFTTAGADVHITGSNTLLFTPRPNGAHGIVERYGYPSDVIVAWDASEQRVQLRERPRRDLRFTPTLVELAEALEVMAKAYYSGSAAFAVPFWPDATPLVVDVAVGAGVVYANTVGRAFVIGGSALLWRDQWTAEAVVIADIFPDHLVLANLTAGLFAAVGTQVIPLEPMRMLEGPTLEHLGGPVAEMPVLFSGEGV